MDGGAPAARSELRVVLTGALGSIGRLLVGELESRHRLRLLDRRPWRRRLLPGVRLDRRWRGFSRLPGPYRLGPWWERAFRGADVVVHLAAESRSDAGWRDLLRDVDVTANVLEVAVSRGVPRVVFASSHWAVEEAQRELAPACYERAGPKIDSAALPRPATLYGLTKALGEKLGEICVADGSLRSFVAVRIGSFHRKAPLTNPRRVSAEDLAALFRRCVEAEFDGFHVVYAVSDPARAPFDLSHTKALLDWEPTGPAGHLRAGAVDEDGRDPGLPRGGWRGIG